MVHSQRLVAVIRSVLTLLAVLGCAAPDPPVASGSLEVQAATAGHLVLSEGRLAFLPCGEGPDTLAVTDTPDSQITRAVAQLGGGDRPVPALLRLAGDTVLELRHAAPEGAGCAGLPGPGDLNARGNEPFWHLRVEGDSATMSTPDLPAGIVYRTGSWSRSGRSRWLFRAGARPDSVRLDLVEERCIDGMSGAWFPYRATVWWQDRDLQGCALEGRGASAEP